MTGSPALRLGGRGTLARGRPAAAWVALGFLAGVLFWHAVGFWQLVSTAVFKGGEDVALATTKSPSPASPGETLSAGPTLPAAAAARRTCAALAIDRISGITREVPCPAATFHHRNGGLGIKRDREPGIRIEEGQGVAGWATRFEPSITEDSQR